MWFLASDVGPEPTQPVQSALGRGDLLCWLERSGAGGGAASSWQRARTEAPQTSEEVYRHVWSGAREGSGTGAGKMQHARYREYSVTSSLTDGAKRRRRRRPHRGNDRECCRVGQVSGQHVHLGLRRRDTSPQGPDAIQRRPHYGTTLGGWALWLPARSARQSRRESCRLCASARDRSDAITVLECSTVAHSSSSTQIMQKVPPRA